MIDPGYGGSDPGPTRGKIFAKHITLAVAQRIKQELENSGRYSVLLTRDRDIFMSARDRVRIAQERPANLFISIHADSIRKRLVRGASVYTLSEKASDEEAAALAANENKSAPPAGVERFDSYGDSTRDLLVKLQQGKALERAKHFSDMLIEALRGENVILLREPHRSGDFTVLRAPEVPSVLVTLGFLSNKRDARLLRSAKHQARLARAIRRAVDRYFGDEISADGDTTGGETTRVKSGTVFRDCPECPEMVVIPAGSFMMGSPASEEGRYRDEGPQHRVTIPRAFALGKYEVTFAEWDACVRDRGCTHRPEDAWGRGRQPVMRVSWSDAREYVGWLSRKTGQTYRLLSESEWEYVARAGTTTAYHFGNRISPSQANYGGPKVYRQQTVAGGSFPANAFGLHDVHGNVWEWVEDCWNASYGGAPTDGTAWTSGDCSRRVLRGGSWGDNPGLVRSANRYRPRTGIRDYGVGFRVAKALEPSPPSEKPPKRIARVAPSPPPDDLPKIPVVPPRQPEPRAEPEPAPRPKPKPRVHATPAPVPEPRPDLKFSAGSGFYVSGDGHVVTNEHVVDGCKKLAVKDADKAVRQVRFIGAGANSDLALLKVDFRPQSFAAFRKGKGARPGEAVAVVGFPLAGTLSSSAKITTGIVNADAGPRDDSGMLQISAPVQPGNSGGPLLDAWGQLIGVVVSRIKDWKVADVYGRPSQNVNFAIKARLVRNLLDAHGVNYRSEAAGSKLDPAGIYERARPFTVLIGCWK